MHLLLLALLVLLGLFLLRLNGTLALGERTSLLRLLGVLFFGLPFGTLLVFVLALKLHGATDTLEKSTQLHGILASNVQNFILESSNMSSKWGWNETA
jgi:hypothetical protein